MRRGLYAVLLTGLFLLLLSALVVTPEPAAPPVAELPADFHAVFRPMISAILPDAADGPAGRLAHSAPVGALPMLLLCAALLLRARDANGHVLSAVRYENSVYQLFRPEVAGG